MGEYIKFKGGRIKIGTCESLYYATYPKYVDALQNGSLSSLEGNGFPEEYARPDAGFLFRFPFPDEDHLSLGAMEYKYNRGIEIKVGAGTMDDNLPEQEKNKTVILEIVQQKLVHRESDSQLILATVCRNPEDRSHFRIEDDQTIRKLIGDIIKNHVLKENDPLKKEFYRAIALRILKGYRFDIKKSIGEDQKSHNISKSENEKPILHNLWQQAYSVYYNNSFSPDKRADNLIKQYSEELKNDLENINRVHSKVNAPQDLTVIKISYQTKYESQLSSWLHGLAATANPMITGPANFPYEQMKKRQQWADNKYDTFRDWRDKSLKAITKNLVPKINELESVRKNLKHREETQRLMVAANKMLRKGGSDLMDNLRSLKLSEGLIMQILNTGFQLYQLRNNNAEIRRLRSRVAVLEAKQSLAQTQGQKVVENDGVKLIQNFEMDRVQLKFDGRPEKEVIEKLKSHGFRWTPSQMAWQRKLTNQAIQVAEKIAAGIKRH